MMRLLPFVALLAACRPLTPPIEIEPFQAAWRLADALPEGRSGDGAIAPIPILVFEPEPPEVRTRMLREQAGVGEIAEMELLLSAGWSRTRVVLKPSRPGVRILGPSVVELVAGRPVVVRFTCDSPGRASLQPDAWAGDAARP